MSKARLVSIVSVIVVVAIVAVSFPLTSAKAEGEHGNHSKMDMKKHVQAKPLSLEKIHSGHLPMTSKSIDKAIKAIEAGDKKTALA